MDSFYQRFSGVRREIGKRSAGGKGFSFILLWKYLQLWRNCQHFDFTSCCLWWPLIASDPRKNKDSPVKKCKSVCYRSVCSPTGFRIHLTEHADEFLYFKTAALRGSLSAESRRLPPLSSSRRTSRHRAQASRHV